MGLVCAARCRRIVTSVSAGITQLLGDDIQASASRIEPGGVRMNVPVINSDSSSVKFELFAMDG